MNKKGQPLQVLSLGAGVQSSTLLLMACVGELEKPDAAIFADTGWEPQSVYRHLAFLEVQAQIAGIPIYRVSAGNLRNDLLDDATKRKTGRIGQPPYYVKNAQFIPESRTRDTLWGPVEVVESVGDKTGKLWRKCTHDYKLIPIRRKTRELMKAAGLNHVEQWIGISTDEAHRMKPADVQYITNRWPLIERRMSRQDCLAWMRAHRFPEPGKSSCLGCPFHDDTQWVQMKAESPEEWADTVAVDRAIRHTIPGVRGSIYMHRSCVPLDEAVLHPKNEQTMEQLNWAWAEECEGICGI